MVLSASPHRHPPTCPLARQDITFPFIPRAGRHFLSSPCPFCTCDRGQGDKCNVVEDTFQLVFELDVTHIHIFIFAWSQATPPQKSLSSDTTKNASFVVIQFFRFFFNPFSIIGCCPTATKSRESRPCWATVVCKSWCHHIIPCQPEGTM